MKYHIKIINTVNDTIIEDKTVDLFPEEFIANIIRDLLKKDIVHISIFCAKEKPGKIELPGGKIELPD